MKNEKKMSKKVENVDNVYWEMLKHCMKGPCMYVRTDIPIGPVLLIFFRASFK